MRAGSSNPFESGKIRVRQTGLQCAADVEVSSSSAASARSRMGHLVIARPQFCNRFGLQLRIYNRSGHRIIVPV